MKYPSLTATVVALAMASPLALADNLRDRASAMFSAIPEEPPVIEGNELTPEKVELGKMLFFEPRLSSSHLISCNTCHNVGMGGHDYLPVSIGHGWQKGPRNSPTVFNAVFNAAQFWDGRAADLAEQAKGPVQAGVEMASTPVRALLKEKGFASVAAEGFEAPGVVVSYTSDDMIHSGKAFLAQGLQTAAGVPLMCDEPASFKTFRIGLFGLDKLHNVERSVANLQKALESL